jgi:hypothetical protein
MFASIPNAYSIRDVRRVFGAGTWTGLLEDDYPTRKTPLVILLDGTSMYIPRSIQYVWLYTCYFFFFEGYIYIHTYMYVYIYKYIYIHTYIYTGWWFQPLWQNISSSSWDDDIPNWMGKKHVPKHQTNITSPKITKWKYPGPVSQGQSLALLGTKLARTVFGSLARCGMAHGPIFVDAIWIR